MEKKCLLRLAVEICCCCSGPRHGGRSYHVCSTSRARHCCRRSWWCGLRLRHYFCFCCYGPLSLVTVSPWDIDSTHLNSRSESPIKVCNNGTTQKGIGVNLGFKNLHDAVKLLYKSTKGHPLKGVSMKLGAFFRGLGLRPGSSYPNRFKHGSSSM